MAPTLASSFTTARQVDDHLAAPDARRLGIAVIFQEFSLVPYLDIAQNIFLGREPKGRLPGTIDRRKLHARRTARVLDNIGFDIDPTALVATARRRAAADGRDCQGAVSQNARILVIDEPTAAARIGDQALISLIRR